MDLDNLRLTLTSEDWHYDMHPIQEVRDGQSKDAFSIAPPGMSPRDNVLLGISGMQGDLRIDFTIWDDGTDRADGTATDANIPTSPAPDDRGGFDGETVVTVPEQIRWLKWYIHRPDFSATWELSHTNGEMYESLPVFIEGLDIPTLSNEQPKWREASMTLRIGGSVG